MVSLLHKTESESDLGWLLEIWRAFTLICGNVIGSLSISKI